MNCYIICDNDSTEFVVIGTEEQATAKLKELVNNCLAQCIRNSGKVQGTNEFYRHYWHIHDCQYMMFTPNGVPVQCRLMDGDDFNLLLERMD